MRRIAPLIAVLFFAPGCFVLEELDKGSEIMDQHSPKTDAQRAKAPAKATAPREKEKDEGEGLIAGVQGWLQDKKPAPERDSGPPPDPDDVPVLCQSAGRTQYVRKSDCLLRGGKIL